MDVYYGDRQIPNGDVFFPDNLTPFPETSDIIFHDRPANIKSPPPEKLRPIRCNGRNLTEYSDPENRALGPSLMTCYVAELGFLTQLLTQKPSVVNGGGPEVECENTPQAYIGSRAMQEIGGGCGGAAAAVQQMKSEMDAEILNLIPHGRMLEAELSSSSNDGSMPLEAIKEPMNRKRKRKRKTRKKLELFLVSTIKKVIQKQEQMHNQLMEMLEKNEQERLIQEEAWKQQEIERSQRDEKIKTEEISPSLALISFIQNLLGQEIQIPKTSCEVSCLEKDVEEITNHEDLKCDPSNRRWPKSEVQSLMTVRTALDHKFLSGHRSSVWEEVEVGLSKMGYSHTANCKEV